MKYIINFEVNCRCSVNVEADSLDDALIKANDKMMTEIDIGERAHDFEWKAISGEPL